MAVPAAASLPDLLLGLLQASSGPDAGNRFSLEGLTWAASNDGALEVTVRRFEATSLRLAAGPLTLEVGLLALNQVVARIRTEGGRPRLWALEAASAELAGLKVQAPFSLPRPGSGPQAAQPQASASAIGGTTAGTGAAAGWSLGPLAAADGQIRAEIVDAHLLFDADVTVPIRQGGVDFNQATVEHVGPDSRMGVSRLGLYVDAANGRSYLYQFATAPVAGVEYERRSALPGPWGTDRGKLRLQPFLESVLRQPPSGPNLGVTEQARLLFDRTAVSGEVQLSDGRFAAPGVQAELVGRADGRNAVRLHSGAVGRGLTLEMNALSVRNAVLSLGDAQVNCADITGVLMLRLFADTAQLRLAFDLASLKIAGLRLQLQPA
jgi:hypothetical protein